MDPREVVARRVRFQAAGCARLGSPLYAGLLGRVERDVLEGGPAWPVLRVFADWPGDSAYVLRVMGALHRLVLTGDAPELAPHFRPGGEAAAAWPAVHAFLATRGEEVRDLALRHAVQTNEVGRCAALAPAILRLSDGRPLRVLEIGASGGLNLRWDAYRYEDLWGDPASAVQLVDRYPDGRPPFAPPAVEVVERRGCDPAPADPTTAEGRVTLASFVWPDQEERMRLLRGAFAVAARVPAPVDAAPASAWLEEHLGPPAAGVVTVVFHSIVWQYLDAEERAAITATLTAAGARATADAPLAWLRMEPDPHGPETLLDVTTWPSGENRRLATVGFHGRPVRWQAED